MDALETLRTGRARFEEGLLALLAGHGAVDGPRLREAVRDAVDHTLDALSETALDGTSLSPLDVVRIRANKLAAVHLPPSLWRAPRTLAALRAEIHALAAAWLG
ncbi:MAG: hypothetical protein ABW252_13170 [Polyangiales bacterium]